VKPIYRTIAAACTVAALFAGSALLAADYSGDSTTPKDKSTADAAKVAAPQARIEQVVIVYKTHFDIGYSALARDVVHRYRTEMVDRVLDAIEQNSRQPKDEQFVWTVSGWPMKQMLWEGQAPERRQKIEQALRDGNLVVHAFPFTMHTETAEMEDLVRGLNISSSIARQYGLPLSTSAKMSDVPGQSWFLPTLFAHAGIKFFHLGGPLVNRTFGLPPMFWWEGPDGSRLLTLYNNGYGTDPLPPKDWPYKNWIYINMTGDNAGPPSPDTVKHDIAFYRSRGIKAKAGRMDDFAELILKEDLGKLPIVRSDLPDPWIYGPISDPAGCRLAHNVRPSIAATDELTTLERCWGIFRPDIRKIIADAYEQSLLFSEHTWGLAGQHYIKQTFGKAWEDSLARGLPPQARVLEESWQEHFDYIDSVRRLMVGPYAEAVSTLADNVNVPGHRIVVYNPLPWKRDGFVTLNICYMPRFSSLKPADGGAAVPVAFEGPALEGNEYNIIRFLARDVPPMGYLTFVPANDKPAAPILAADAAAGVIESPFFKATLDAKRGRIASLIDKRTGRELVDGAAPQGFGQYFYERFGINDITRYLDAALYPQYGAHRFIMAKADMPKDSAYVSACPENMTLAVEKSSIDVSAVMTGVIAGPGLPQTVSIRLTLPAHQPVADLEVGWQKQPDGWSEAGWICLPFKIDNPKFRLGRLGADVDPVANVTIDNVNYHQSWVNTGVAVYDTNGAGISLCPMDSPMVSLGEPGVLNFDKRYEPKKAYVYLNLYNNIWQTNFRNWVGNGSRMSSRVRLWTFDKFQAEPSLYSPAMEARTPLCASRSDGKPGNLPASQPGLTLSRNGVAVTAFGPSPDGAGTVLRVWEQGGISGNITVTLPGGAKFTTAKPVELRGGSLGEPVNVQGGALKFKVRAYAPASFILE